MKKVSFIAGLISLGLLSCIVFARSVNAAGSPIVFDLPEGMDPAKVFVQFISTGGSITGVYRNKDGHEIGLKVNTAYSMAEITSTVPVSVSTPAGKPAVLISEFLSGRIYVNFGDTGIIGMTQAKFPGVQPGDPGYNQRWQYFEPTIDATHFASDISYIDCASIAWSLEAKNAPTAENPKLMTTVDSQTLAEKTAAAASPPNSNVYPVGKILPSPDFIRVLGAQSDGAKYHDWTHYLKTTLQKKTTHIAGVFQGVGHQPSGNILTQSQTYDFHATFDSEGNAHLAAQPGSGNGNAVSVVESYRGPGIGDNVQITIEFSALNSVTGIYGNNASYTYTINGQSTTTGGIENDLMGWIVGDLMAGLSYGFPGSTVLFKGKPVGDMFSSEWWGSPVAWDPYKASPNNQIPRTDTPAGNHILFETAQPGQPLNYDRYSNSLLAITTGYGFSLEDRFAPLLTTVFYAQNPAWYLLVTINPDDHGTEYTVTPSAGANGTISPNNPQQVKKGDTKAFTVTPNAGYIAAVAGTCGGTLVGTTYTTSAITADCTVEATFTTVTQHTVSATAGAHGTISPDNWTVNDGDRTSFTVTPDTGYTAAVAGTCGGNLVRNTYTTNAITGDCTVDATFTASTGYTVTPSAGANGSITPNSVQTVHDGRTMEFTVTPNAGYKAAVSGTCGGRLVGTLYTTNVITADCTVEATFTDLVQHTVTPSAGANGSISPNTAQTVNDGLTTSFTVTPNTGYFAAVSGTCGGTLVGTTYTTNAITADCTVDATFSLPEYIVHGVAGAGGSIAPSTRIVNPGQTTTFTVTPDVGYRILDVTGCGGTLTGNTYVTGPITGGSAVTATFTKVTNVPVPTLSEWGMMILFLLMLGTGAVVHRRRNQRLS